MYNGIYLKISEIDTKNHKFQNQRKINETYRYYPFYFHFLLLNFICIYYFSVYYSNSEYKYYRSEPWISCLLEPHILSCKEHSDRYMLTKRINLQQVTVLEEEM